MDWLKYAEQDEWSAQLSALSLRVTRTMFGNYTYTVSDPQRMLKAGNVGDLEAAKPEAVRLANGLS